MAKGMYRRGLYSLILALALSKAHAQIGPPPIIVLQPASQTASYGSTVKFTVTATSLTPMTYQWRFNGTNISSGKARSATYQCDEIKFKDAGGYSCVITNASGYATSVSATLTVINQVRIESAQMTDNGFRVQVSGPLLSTYVLYATSDFQDWTPIATNSGLTGSTVFVDAAATNLNHRFYHVEAH